MHLKLGTLRFFRLMKNLTVALGPIVVLTPARKSSCNQTQPRSVEPL